MNKKKKMSIEDSGEVFDYYDVSLERSLLKYIATKDFSLNLIVESEYFYGQGEKILFKILKELQTHYPINSLKKVVLDRVVKSKSEIVLMTLNAIIESETVTNRKSAEEIAETLKNKFLKRNIIQSAENAIALVNENKIDRAFESMRLALVSDFTRVKSGDYLEDFELRKQIVEERIKNTKSLKTDLIFSGILPFDKDSGGILRGEVGVIMGKTGGGKSLMKLNIALSAYLAGYNVIHVGLEMRKEENEFRADTILTQIPVKMFRLAKLSKQDLRLWEEVILKLRKTQKNYLEFVTGKRLTIQEIFGVIESIQHKQGKRCDVFILDHLVLVRDDRNNFETHDRLWALMDELTYWAELNSVAVWTSSQMTDEGIKAKEGVKITHLKYGRIVGEIAHIVLALHQSEMDAVSGDMGLYVLKGRNISSGKKYILRPDMDNMIIDTNSFANLGLSLIDIQKQFGKERKRVGSL